MKETVAGVIFISLWVVGLVLWGNSKNIKADVSNERNQVEDCRLNGHPLWTDC